MSVIVKGMDMPISCANWKNGEPCPMLKTIVDGDEVIGYDEFKVCCLDDYNRYITNENQVQPYCPLVEVSTPHGRLIDADALGISFAERKVFIVPEYADGWNSVVRLINDAPTVIEEEK